MNAQSREQPVEPLPAAPLDVGADFLRHLFADRALDDFVPLLDFGAELGDLRLPETVNVSKGAQQPLVDELVDQLLAQPLDVHLPAVAEPPQPLLELRVA